MVPVPSLLLLPPLFFFAHARGSPLGPHLSHLLMHGGVFRARPAHAVSETVDKKGVRRCGHNSGESKRADEAKVRISVRELQLIHLPAAAIPNRDSPIKG